ncbi:Alpha/beta hydrolase fold-3, partial [Backusella circina FSU 941]
DDVIKAQVLIYPFVSATRDFPSHEKYGQGEYLLSLKVSSVFSKTYFPVSAEELNNPYGTPLILPVEKLTGLPPALVLTAECDILRDEGEAYSNKLLQAGNDVVGIRVLGTIHGF